MDFVCVNDFSYYDNVLDLAYALGVKPKRFKDLEGLDLYFAMARGHKNGVACAMTKWFNTNYHFVVPELDIDNKYILNIDFITKQHKEALQLGYTPKISLIGFFTFFHLSHIVNGEKQEVFEQVKTAYLELIDALVSALGKEIVIEFSEPIFALGLDFLICETTTLKNFYNTLVKRVLKPLLAHFLSIAVKPQRFLVKQKFMGSDLIFFMGAKI